MRGWGEKRAEKATGLRAARPDSVRHDWAFITQPGHIPERARMNARDERAMEHGAIVGPRSPNSAGATCPPVRGTDNFTSRDVIVHDG